MTSFWRLGFGATTFMASCVFVTPAVEAMLCPAELAEQIDIALSAPPLEQAYVGMLLQTQATTKDDRQILYARHADHFFTPASGAKLLTTAAALHRLGPDYRIRTSIYGDADPAGLTNLQVVGRGDPTLTDNQLIDLAEQLSYHGIAQVNQLVMQDAYFPQFATNPTWEWGDAQWYYAPPVNSLILNGNAVTVEVAPTQVGSPLSITWPANVQRQPLPINNDTATVADQPEILPLNLWRTGGGEQIRVTGQMAAGASPVSYNLAVLDPVQQFTDALIRALGDQGISVAQAEMIDQAISQVGPELAAVNSPPLWELLIPTNQDSHNLYAEVLFKTLGVTQIDPPFTDASTAGGEAIRKILADLGVDSATVRLADGSGLSRHNLVTPAAMAETLQAMAVHPNADVYLNSLAVAGVSGTLSNRLGETVLEGRVQGKSGALTGNVSLSGYLQPPNYEPLVFTILINHSDQHASILRDHIDQILLLISQLSSEC